MKTIKVLGFNKLCKLVQQ